MEAYLQETGRAGRDGLSSKAVLFYTKNDLRSEHISNEMKVYCRNEDKCRRELLLSAFDGDEEYDVPSSFVCCDVCNK